MIVKFTKNDKIFQNKKTSEPWFDSEKIEFSEIHFDQKIGTTNIKQELNGKCLKDQVGLFILYTA